MSVHHASIALSRRDTQEGGGREPRPELPSILRQGTWRKAEIRVRHVGGMRVVVKDTRHVPHLLRPLAALLCRREARTYRRLAEVEGVPRLLDAARGVLTLEHVEGRRICDFAGSVKSASVCRDLQQVVERMHGAGVYHLDLRTRDNILVDGDGRVSVIDFAGAVWLRRRSLLGRLMAPWLARLDSYGVLKWKRLLDAAGMTAAENRFLRRMDRLRRRRPQVR